MNGFDYDLELIALRKGLRKRFGAYIQFVKEKVGAGQEYNNGLVRVVLNERGGYYEMVDCPEEFSGFVGNYEYEFIDKSKSLRQLDRLFEYVRKDKIQENAYRFALIMLYSTDILDKDNIYAFYWNPQDTAYMEIGRLQPKLPDFYKVKWSLKPNQNNNIFPFQSGMMFFVKKMTDKHLIVSVPCSDKMTLNEMIDATAH